jgi:hypothetical protein
MPSKMRTYHMCAPLFRLQRALHSNEIARFQMDTSLGKIRAKVNMRPGFFQDTWPGIPPDTHEVFRMAARGALAM